MRKLKVTRSMILSFVSGMGLSNLTVGVKICIAAPLVILWFMSYDDALVERKGRKYDHSIR